MLLVVDVGNTQTHVGLFSDRELVATWRFATEREKTGDELAVVLDGLLRLDGFARDMVTGFALASGVPRLVTEYSIMSADKFGVEALVIGPGIKTGMPIKYDNPKEVGADRIVNAVGAFEKHKTALVVVDFGTATTFDYVSEEGAYMGGAIAPGILISCEALFQKASKLPRVEIFARPKTVIARDTISSMNAGIIFGYAGLVDRDRRVRDRRQGQGIRAQVPHDPACLQDATGKQALERRWRLGGPMATGRRLSRVRPGLGQRRIEVLRRWRAGPLRRKHALAPRAVPDLRQRDDAAVVWDA